MAENIVKGGYADVGNLLDAGGDNCCSRWGRCSGNQECIDCKCQYRDDDSRLPSFDDSQSPSQPYIVNVPSSGVIGGQPVSLGFSGFEGQTGSETEIQTWEEFEDDVPFDGKTNYFNPTRPLNPNGYIEFAGEEDYYNLSLMRPETAEQAKGNCLTNLRWSTRKFQTGEALTEDEKSQCAGPWMEDENGNWRQVAQSQFSDDETEGVSESPLMKYIIGGVIAIVLINVLKK